MSWNVLEIILYIIKLCCVIKADMVGADRDGCIRNDFKYF